jgi:hypothetical protein
MVTPRPTKDIQIPHVPEINVVTEESVSTAFEEARVQFLEVTIRLVKELMSFREFFDFRGFDTDITLVSNQMFSRVGLSPRLQKIAIGFYLECFPEFTKNRNKYNPENLKTLMQNARNENCRLCKLARDERGLWICNTNCAPFVRDFRRRAKANSWINDSDELNIEKLFSAYIEKHVFGKFSPDIKPVVPSK